MGWGHSGQSPYPGKIDKIQVKINFILQNVFFWMIILLIPEMNIIYVSSLI